VGLVVDDATGILLVDLQNDFLAPDGAYGRAGVSSPEMAALPDRLAPVLDAARAASIPVISTQFTLLTVRGREPLISAHLSAKRPFLGAGDFEAGTRGHALVDSLGPADIVIQKIAYSAFYASPLEHVLARLGLHCLIVAGILTNGGVASTVRAAHVLGYETWVAVDGCADLQPDVHDLALRSLAASTSSVVRCGEVIAALESYAGGRSADPARSPSVTSPGGSLAHQKAEHG
jgi:nicotinamidase-related amidase